MEWELLREGLSAYPVASDMIDDAIKNNETIEEFKESFRAMLKLGLIDSIFDK